MKVDMENKAEGLTSSPNDSNAPVKRRFGKMKSRKEIMKALQEMETRKTSYLLDMSSYKSPNSVVYDTEIIRKLEVTDAVVNALSWVLSRNGA